MHDEFETYQKNHNTEGVKKTELQKIAKDRQTLSCAKRKIHKHRYHDAQELEEHYEDILQAEHIIRKSAGNMKTRRKRLQNFIKNGHID